jgi:nitrate reductase gamma subunit
MRDTIFHILFVWYPYVCLSAFVFGSIIRFDREQYTWRASSSQLLRRRQLTWGSNLFHFGILFLVVFPCCCIAGWSTRVSARLRPTWILPC